MAVALDQNLGSNSVNSVTSVVVTTGATAAVGSKIFVLMSWFNPGGTTASVSGGSLTWTNLKQVANGSDRFAIFCADAPSGLASGTAITVSQLNANQGGLLAGAVSFTGLATGTTVDTTNQNTTTGTGWSSGAAAPSAVGNLLIGGAGNETLTTTSSTATNGAEIHDLWNSGAQQGFATGFLVAASTASQALTGTWTTSSTATTGALVIFPAAAGAVAPPPELTMAPRIPFY